MFTGNIRAVWFLLNQAETYTHYQSGAQQKLHNRQLPFRRKPQWRPGHGVAIASVLGARWPRHGLRHTRFQSILSVLALPPSIRSAAQQTVSGNRAPAHNAQ
jgi:hypothetical protein